MVVRGLQARTWSAVSVVLALSAVTGLASAAKVPRYSNYRPPPIRPVIRSLPGEGRWRAAGTPIAGRPPVLLTTFRPDAGDPSDVAYVAWIDHTRTQLALYPGSSQPPTALPRGPAEIPNGERWRLLAAFNGGFEYGSHSGGGGGFAVNGRTYSLLQPGLGTLLAYRDGRVDVVAWKGSAIPGKRITFARQDLSLLVQAGHPGRDLASQAEWGWTLGGGDTTWRTGVGIESHGNLIYAAAPTTAAGLAAILIRAGAVRAIELDINPEWPTFNIYAHRHGLLPSKFVPNPQQATTRYLWPERRDFFAVYRRIPGAVTVPFR